jgi:magnesium transporter
MLTAYLPNDQCLAQDEDVDEAQIKKAAWIDLLNPTTEEEKRLERALGINAPTREEMQEIEISNRLYTENNAVYMTATVLSRLETESPLSSPVTFVLLSGKLITVRYAEPRPFLHFMLRARKPGSGYISGPLIMFGLIEALVNRLADVLEQIGVDIDTLSRDIFDHDPAVDSKRDFQDILRQLGHKGILSSKIRESLVSIARVIHFLFETVDLSHLDHARDLNNRIKALDKDIVSLLDHVNYFAAKVNFLLDATLGQINIEQNTVIKFFTIVTVVLMPPMMISTIYGMNFKYMPELNWHWGYPVAVAAMVISAVFPYAYFRRRGWF